MREFLTKPLDRWTIELARRCMAKKRSHQVDLNGLAPASALDAFPVNWPIAVPQFELASDGSFQFPSPVATASEKNNRVFGQFYQAATDWRDYPTAILLHGWNAELCYRHMFPYLASLLRQKQINTAILQLPYHMHRRPLSGSVTDFISSDIRRMLEATRQALADIGAICSWLRRESVRPVGLWGFSLGAWLTGLLLRMDPDLGFGVLTTPIARIDQAMRELPFCEPVREGLAREAIDLRELNLAARPPRVSSGQILLIESEHDLFAPAESIEELWRAWSQPEIWRVRHGHISILLSVPLMRKSVRWIERAAATRISAAREGS